MRYLILILLIGLCSDHFAQSWQKSGLSNSSLIEDIGQCAEFEHENNVDVKYMMYGSSAIYYIHNHGFSVFKGKLNEEVFHEKMEELEASFDLNLSYEQREEIEYERSGAIFEESTDSSTVHFRYAGFDIIESEEEYETGAKYHFTGSNKIQLTNAKEYSQITCYNKETGAAVEFFPKDGGLKYNVILPNEKALKEFRWDIDKECKVVLAENGNIEISKGVLNLTDQAPTTVLSTGEELQTNFNLEGNSVSFEIRGTPEWPLTIDPWVTDFDSIFAEVLNVETDGSAGVYVYLNTATFNQDEVRKYSSNGTLIWSNIFYANSQTNGDLDIDHEASTIFLSAIGSVGKYDENGINLWTTAFNEAWTLEFNCSENQFIGGGNWGVNGSKLHNLDTETGQPLSAFLLPNDSLFISDEVRSATSSPAGDYYFLSLQHVLKMCSGMQIDYQIPNGHTPLNYGGPSYPNQNFGGNSIATRGEVNAIAVDSQYLYTYDGQHLIQRIASSGVFVKDTIIPSGVVSMNGGIIVDDCRDIYIGTQTHVIKLDDDFNTLDTLAVATPVFDLAFNDSNQIMITGVDNLTSATFNHCYKQLCNPPDTFPYSISRDTLICFGDSMTLSASGGDSYSWFPNYKISNTDSNVTIVSPDTTTTYGVLIRFDSCNYRIGYIRVKVDTATRYELPNDTTICEGDSVALLVSGTAPSFLVEDTLGNYSDTGTLFNLKPTESTYYEISGVGLDSSACMSSYFIEVYENSFPDWEDTVIQCKAIPTEFPYVPSDSVTWSPLDGIVFGDSIATILKTKSEYIYISQKDFGVCNWVDSFYLWIAPGPDIFIEPFDSVICRGDERLLKVTGATSYTWNPDSIVEVVDEGFILRPKDSLTVQIIGEDSLGCIDSTFFNFHTKPSAYAHIFLNDTTVCLGEPVTIHVEGDSGLVWKDSLGITQVGPFSYRYIPQDIKELTLVSAPEDYCPDTSFVTVFVHKISSNNQLDTTICRGESVVFKPRVDGKYSLQPNFNVVDNGENEFVLTPYSSTNYFLTNDVGCLGNDSIRIKVIDCSYFTPNVVTPDGDGKNDLFFIKSDNILVASGKIYNRWGNLVYENDLQQNPWDCSKGNGTVTDGTYFYSIDVLTKDGERFRLRGEFTIFSE